MWQMYCSHSLYNGSLATQTCRSARRPGRPALLLSRTSSSTSLWLLRRSARSASPMWTCCSMLRPSIPICATTWPSGAECNVRQPRRTQMVVMLRMTQLRLGLCRYIGASTARLRGRRHPGGIRCCGNAGRRLPRGVPPQPCRSMMQKDVRQQWSADSGIRCATAKSVACHGLMPTSEAPASHIHTTIRRAMTDFEHHHGTMLIGCDSVASRHGTACLLTGNANGIYAGLMDSRSSRCGRGRITGHRLHLHRASFLRIWRWSAMSRRTPPHGLPLGACAARRQLARLSYRSGGFTS